MARLSHLPSERRLQWQVIATVGTLVVFLLVLFVGVLSDFARDLEPEPSAEVPLRAGFGVVLVLVSLRLPWLVRRHREELRTIAGLKDQYVRAAGVTAVFGCLWMFYWYTGLVAVLVAIASLVAVLRIDTVPEAEMVEQVDYRDPDAWQDASARMGTRRYVLLLVGTSVVLLVLIVAVLLGVVWIRDS